MSATPGPRVTRVRASAIVNEAFVKRYLAGRNPLGALICQGSGPDAQPTIEIVGVVADFSYRGLREQSEQAYFPLLEGSDAGGHFYVKVRGTPEQAAQSIRSIVHDSGSRSADHLSPNGGRTSQPIVEHRAHPGNPLRRFWGAGAAAVAGRTVRRDVVCGHRSARAK